MSVATIHKPRILEGREYERWLLDITSRSNSDGIELFALTTVTTNITLSLNNSTIYVTTAGITLALPTAAIPTGKSYTIDNASTGDITVSGSIEGETSQIVPSDSCMQIYYTGTTWRIK